MESTEVFEKAKPTHQFIAFVRGIDRRTKLMALAAAAVGAALYLGWGWLTAAGLTTFIVGLLPCAVMCGLGLCASRFTGTGQGKCHGSADAGGTDAASNSQSKP